MNSGTWRMWPCRRCGKGLELNIALPEVRAQIREGNAVHEVCSIFERMNETYKEEENV